MRGYLFEELGPKAFEGKGKEDLDRETERLIERGKWIKENGMDGCPFAPLN
jgi:hypothetical protein